MREFFERLGKWAGMIVTSAGGMALMLFQAILWMFVPPLKLRNIFKQMEFVGVKSLFVVILTGAFTGAVSRKEGLFQITNGGTLFLDEIGDLSLPMQSKLLRTLQDKEITRVGGKKNISLDVRIVAATNRDLMKMMQENMKMMKAGMGGMMGM